MWVILCDFFVYLAQSQGQNLEKEITWEVMSFAPSEDSGKSEAFRLD